MSIFISYAHIDDQPIEEGQKGWIAQFHRQLEIRLAQLLGEQTPIWRDPKLTGNDIFGEAIVNQIPQAQILVSVLLPRYVNRSGAPAKWRPSARRPTNEAASA